MKISLYHKDVNGKKEIIKYNATGIQVGTARQILGEDDARGNGIPLNAPLVRVLLPGMETATYDADDVTIMFNY